MAYAVDPRLVREVTQSRPRRSGRIFLSAIVLLGALVVVGYLFLVPALVGRAPDSLDFLPVTLLSPGEAVSCPIPSEQTYPVAQQQKAQEGTIEIQGLTVQGDTLVSLFSSNLSGDSTTQLVTASLAEAMSRSLGKSFHPLDHLKADKRYSITLDRTGGFLSATVEWNAANVFHSVREPDGIRSWKEDVVLEYRPQTVCLSIRSSLYQAVYDAGEGAELFNKLRNVFMYDIHFESDSRRGDQCWILFERRFADDRPSGYGEILAAVYEGRRTGRKTAIRFDGTYFNEKGFELKKSFLRSPLKNLRVTSRFGRRLHPVDKIWKHHNGVDYGAPVGTEVWSVARGVVKYAGWMKGYGKIVRIRHENGLVSGYGHLHKIFVKKGQPVKQKQVIGLVGKTGKVTGPHLDFQLLKNGKFIDPQDPRLKMARGDGKRVASPLKRRFQSVVGERLGCFATGPQGAEGERFANLR